MKFCHQHNHGKGAWLDESEFSKDKSAKDGLHARCKKCDSSAAKKYHAKHPDVGRKNKLKKNYGLTPEEYERMFIAQKGRCAICGRHQDDLVSLLAVDHDHATGKVRGLICTSCNHVLGRVGDNVSILLAAIDYLNRGGYAYNNNGTASEGIQGRVEGNGSASITPAPEVRTSQDDRDVPGGVVSVGPDSL